MIKIERATPSDNHQATAIVNLLNEYALHPMGGGEALSEYTRNNLAKHLAERDDCVVILAWDDKEAVGLCNCFEGFSTFASRPLMNIHDVYVKQSHRGQGIAAQMMQKAEEIARDRGCCKMTLEVLNHNEKAKVSYLASGYSPYQLDERHGHAEFWQKPIL